MRASLCVLRCVHCLCPPDSVQKVLAAPGAIRHQWAGPRLAFLASRKLGGARVAGTRRWGRVGSMPNDEVEREHAMVGVQDLERSRRTCCGEWRWRPERATGALVAPGCEAALPSHGDT